MNLTVYKNTLFFGMLDKITIIRGYVSTIMHPLFKKQLKRLCARCEVSLVQDQKKLIEATEPGDETINYLERVNNKITEIFNDAVKSYHELETKLIKRKQMMEVIKRKPILPHITELREFGRMPKSYSETDPDKPVMPKIKKIMELYIRQMNCIEYTLFDACEAKETPENAEAMDIMRSAFALSKSAGPIFKYLPSLDFSKSEINKMIRFLENNIELTRIMHYTHKSMQDRDITDIEKFNIQNYRHNLLFRNKDVKDLKDIRDVQKEKKISKNSNTPKKERQAFIEGKNHYEFSIVMASCEILQEALKKFQIAQTALNDIYESLEQKEEIILRVRETHQDGAEEIVQRNGAECRKNNISGSQPVQEELSNEEKSEEFLTKKQYHT